MPRIDPAKLEAAAARLLEALGTPEPAAATVAASLVDADLRGHGSHGVVRLATTYASMVEDGDLDPSATPAVVSEDPVGFRIDGHGGFGQVTARHAIDRGVELAADRGVAVIGLRNGSHIGRVGEWAERAAAADLVCLGFVNTGLASRTVTIPGSADRMLSTNPIVVGLPTFGAVPFPVVLDVATSQVAHGKVTKRSVEGRPLPASWTMTETGTGETDAKAFEDGSGALLPLGGRTSGHKGYGFAVVSELLAAVFGGGEVFGEGEPGAVNNAAMFTLVDPLRFTTRERARESIAAFDAYLDQATRSESIPRPDSMWGEEPLLPGEPEYLTAREREREGIPMDDRTLSALQSLAVELGVEGTVSLR